MFENLGGKCVESLWVFFFVKVGLERVSVEYGTTAWSRIFQLSRKQFSLSLGKGLKNKRIYFVTQMKKIIQSSAFKTRC